MWTRVSKRLALMAISAAAAGGSIAVAGPPLGGPVQPPRGPLPATVCTRGWTAAPAVFALVRGRYTCTSNAVLASTVGQTAVCDPAAGYGAVPTLTKQPNGQVVAGPTITLQHQHGVYTCANEGTQAVSLVPR
jgi:hypothetical protein